MTDIILQTAPNTPGTYHRLDDKPTWTMRLPIKDNFERRILV